MINNKLSKRLNLIASVVDGDNVVDVGCDHGKVANYLLTNNIVKHCICTDISLPSVKKAENLLNLNHVASCRFDIRHGDGLSTINEKDTIDTVIIAGMGGKETIKILSNCLLNIPTLVLQPQKNVLEVKRYLINNNYNIVFDKIVEEDGKFYTVIKAKMGTKTQSLTDYELNFGKDNFNSDNADFIKYLDYQSNKYEKLLNLVTQQDRQEIENMLNLINKARRGMK